MERMPSTPAGFTKLAHELDDLIKRRRPAIIQRIADAREHGDLKENAEYSAAKEEQAFIEGRISYLEDIKARTEIIDNHLANPETIKFGAYVKVHDEATEQTTTFQIVGEYEADIDANLISIKSPLARALIGKSADENVEVHTPKGVRSYEIISVSY